MPNKLISQRTARACSVLTAVVAVIFSLLPRIPATVISLLCRSAGLFGNSELRRCCFQCAFWRDRNLRTAVPARVKSRPVGKALSPIARTMALQAPRRNRGTENGPRLSLARPFRSAADDPAARAQHSKLAFPAITGLNTALWALPFTSTDLGASSLPE